MYRYIVDRSIESRVSPEMASKIAFCESRLDPLAYNSKTHDLGLFQINRVHWPTMKKMGLDPKNYEDNTDYAFYLMKKNGYRDWNASKHCWSKVSVGDILARVTHVAS